MVGDSNVNSRQVVGGVGEAYKEVRVCRSSHPYGGH